MSRAAAVVLAATLGSAVAASLSCSDDSVSGTAGLVEPLQVQAGQFISGALPGLKEPAANVDAGPAVTPDVVDVSVANTVIAQGEQGLVFTGHVSTDAQTVAVHFDDLGSGYWVVPVGPPDPSDDGLLTWQLTADFGRGLPPGRHLLVFAALDAAGRSGTQSTLLTCIDTPVPDNLNACVPTRTPPTAVLSLDWSAPVDLDLSVLNPDGVTVGGKSSRGPSADGGASQTVTTSTATVTSADGVLDHDSNRACVIDGIDREDIVWQAPPASGVYQVYVDPWSTCGLPAATFTVALWLAETQADGTQRLVQQSALANGELLAIQADNGASKGLFVGQFVIQ
jgi:hypothetical protein